ncbi:MAG TPA: hypothetical protein VFI31_04275 [Pirellulales bacterium]|nr:hypothetical protein [Pirellulales bacterium]
MAKGPLPKAPSPPNKSTPPGRSSATKGATPPKVAAKAPAASSAPQAPATTADEKAPQAGTKSYKLRYKFKPGETLRWEVEHRAKVRSTVQGTTQAAETISTSVKNWKVDSVDADGNAVIIHSVDHVEMTQKLDGRQDIHYSSDTDAVPPPVFENVAKAVGKPLARLTLDPRGKVLEREEHYVQAAPQQENVTLPLPENAVTLGEEWTMPADIMVTLPDNVTKKIKARQLYRLEAVDDGIASLHLETQILTPVNDPRIESQLVQSKASGVIRFDLSAGRVVSQQNDVDEHVQGFQGPASSMHYVTRFIEKLLPDANRAAVLPRAPTSR